MSLPGGPPPGAIGATDLRQVGEMVTFGEHRKPTAVPRWMLLVALVVAQAFFARVMSQLPILGFGQALVLMAIGAWALLRRDALLSLSLIAYLPGTEIVWRQAQAPVPQYTAAYIGITLALFTALASRHGVAKPARTAVLYFALLLPSSFVTVATTGGSARQAITFALVGPATLMVMVALICQFAIEPWFYRRLLWILVIGGIGPLAIALTAIGDTLATEGSLDFTSQSNFITSGGFGPVQVSSVMGLTVLGAILLVVAEADVAVRALAGVLALVATVQCLLTFSRGGMFATALALGALAISQSSDPKGRRRVSLVVAVAFAIGYFLIVPRLDSYTDGALKERFGDTSTGRTSLATNDVRIFRDHLAFGVGPGMSKYSRLPYELCQLRTDRCANEGSSHTEFTRMLSEHGLAGALSIGVFAVVAVGAYRRSGASRATCIVFLTWAVAQMFYANLRVVAIPIAFGFAFLRVGPAPDDTLAEPEPSPAPLGAGLRAFP